jgi:regulator of protease activity HflC (stomatin/prohibitin superfamily)
MTTPTDPSLKNQKSFREHPGFACSGWAFLLIVIGLLGFAVSQIAMAVQAEGGIPLPAIAGAVLGMLCLSGLFTLQPNQAAITSFFGAYSGTVRGQGLSWTIPFFGRQIISLRSRNFNTPTLKVNDKRGNPVEIAAAIVWRIDDTAKARYEVENYEYYVSIQSESAVRRVASGYAYDHAGDDLDEITLRDGGEEVAQALCEELQERLARAGILVEEARFTHLAYAQEIAQAMLRRQQAEAVISARRTIVKGAVDIVEMAIDGLREKQIVELDPARKAALVSNLLVVLCGEAEVTPVVNTGSSV